MREEHKSKKEAELDLSGWNQVIAKKIPQQMNGSDCGMFTCIFAEYLSRRARFTFSQSNMPYFRKRMVYEICKNQLVNLDTAAAHDSMNEEAAEDGGSETPQHSVMNLLSPDALQEMKNEALNNQNNAVDEFGLHQPASAAPPSVSPASLQTDNRHSEITSSHMSEDEEDIGVQDMDEMMEKIGLVEIQDDTLLLTQNKSPTKQNRSINKILENITEDVQEDEIGHGVIENDEEDEDTRDQLNVSKKRKGRLRSDSEESDTEETVKPEDTKDYDSEENEVAKPAKAKQELFDKKGKLRRPFYVVEAELSEEEDGRADVSDNEDEKVLDRFEKNVLEENLCKYRAELSNSVEGWEFDTRILKQYFDDIEAWLYEEGENASVESYNERLLCLDKQMIFYKKLKTEFLLMKTRDEQQRPLTRAPVGAESYAVLESSMVQDTVQSSTGPTSMVQDTVLSSTVLSSTVPSSTVPSAVVQSSTVQTSTVPRSLQASEAVAGQPAVIQSFQDKASSSAPPASSGPDKRGGKKGGEGSKTRDTRDRSVSPPDLSHVDIDPDEPTYCLCDQVSYGEMIGCDNDLCPIEWFHFTCVQLSSKPKGKWFCPRCRGDKPTVMKPKAQFLKELEKFNKEKEDKVK